MLIVIVVVDGNTEADEVAVFPQDVSGSMFADIERHLASVKVWVTEMSGRIQTAAPCSSFAAIGLSCGFSYLVITWM